VKSTNYRPKGTHYVIFSNFLLLPLWATVCSQTPSVCVFPQGETSHFTPIQNSGQNYIYVYFYRRIVALYKGNEAEEADSGSTVSDFSSRGVWFEPQVDILTALTEAFLPQEKVNVYIGFSWGNHKERDH
jgi:hypothetical protein